MQVPFLPSFQTDPGSIPTQVPSLHGFHPDASFIPNSEEKYKPRATGQDSALGYQSQYSVPYGEQEQSSSNQSLPNSSIMANSLQHVHGKIDKVHLTDQLQSSANSFGDGEEKTHYVQEVPIDDENKPQDPSQSLSYDMSVSMATSQRTSDSGEEGAQNGVLDNRGPTHRGRSLTDGAIVDTRSDRHQRISQPSAEKVPVERVMSNDDHDAAAQDVIKKCPVEMNYKSISKYFNSGGKNLGEGGFGIVYEGKTVKYIHLHVSASNCTRVVR